MLDFHIKDNIVRDCKCVGRTPSKLKQSYVIQGALYRKAEGLDVVFDFIVANKKPVVKEIRLTDEEYSFGLAYLTRASQVIEEIEECTNPKRMMELMSFPNLEAVWNPEERRDLAHQWGIM